MKKLHLLLIIALTLNYSCENATSDPKNNFDENANGAWLRTVALNPNFNLNDINSATFEITLEENDLENGNLLSSVNVYLAFVDNTPASTDLSTTELLYETLSASQFDTSTGKPRVTHSVTALAAASFFNIDPANFSATDAFTFRYELVLTDGRTFSDYNASGDTVDTTKDFYGSPFKYNGPFVCPVESTFAVGSYYLKADQPGIFEGTIFDEVVTLSVGSSATKRAFNATWDAEFGYGNVQPYQFDLVCGFTIWDPDQATGLGCSGSIHIDAGATNANYDPNDDSTLLVNILENNLGDCGSPMLERQLIFTKL